MNNVHINQMEINEISNKKKYYSVIESLLFVSGDPLRLKDISEILECKDSFAEGLMIELMNIYENEEQRGIKLIKINEAYQFVTKTCNSNFVQKLLKTNIRQSLSQASLETLAIIAYKQPITRIDIEEIRGVKSDRAIYTLLERKLIKESGRKEVAGRPILYSTTEEFLKYFQLQSLKELPNLDSFDIEEELIDEHDII